MNEINKISKLPRNPAIYAMYGGRGGRIYVAYVGSAGKLKDRITQHLVRRDSSVTTGTSATALLPENVTEVRWWEHDDFAYSISLQAAEFVAFEVLEPSLRSRGVLADEVKRLLDDANFKDQMTKLFDEPPTGRLILPSLDIAFDRIQTLEKRIAELESEVKQLKDSR